MRGKLPRTCNVQKEIARNACFEGEVELSHLSRLVTSVINDEASLNVKFEFSRNEIGLAQIVGKIRTTLSLECMRCMQTMPLEITVDFNYLLDVSEEDVEASGLDNIESDAGFIDVYSLIEDEVILALPLVPKHEHRDCNDFWSHQLDQKDEIKKENPFAVLAKLKSNS